MALKDPGTLRLTDSPSDAVKKADVVYTDAWVSMGMEAETDQRRRDLSAFRVDEKLLALAKKRTVLLALPAGAPRRRGHERRARQRPVTRVAPSVSPSLSDDRRLTLDKRGEVMTKTQRQHRIGELIERERISTAAQLVTRLQSEGISATQATVTRDLQELGTIKVRDENGVRRIVTATASTFTHAPLDHLRRMMGEWVVSVESSENLVVVRTPPGCAHVVASALDRSSLEGVLGSVAGDDTVLVIADEKRGGMSLATEFRCARRTRRLELLDEERQVAMTKRVVLAYSGGLDTSVAIRWMIEEWGVEVVCVLVNVGQDVEQLRELRRHPRARARRGRGGLRAGRRATRDGRGVLRQGDPRQRPLREQVPARVGAVASGDRAPPRRPGPARSTRRPSRTDARARATTRFASKWAPTRSRPTSKCSRRRATGA